MKLPKFALVTAHPDNCGVDGIRMGDFWNMYGWMSLFKESYHYSFDMLKDDYTELDKYDIVMFSGHNKYLTNIINLAHKTKAVTIFFPEGDISLYHDRKIIPEVYMAWDACDIVGIVEEDKIGFYESLTRSCVRFLHIPVPNDLCNGLFYAGTGLKNRDILVYGDNNPNNPIIVFGVASMMGLPVSINQIDIETINFVKSHFNLKVSRYEGKVDQLTYLRNWVAPSKVIIYPTRWIGTARQTISGAMCGTPVIGNRDSHTQKRLFPSLGVSIYDVDKICELTNKLYTDNKFYDECCKYAFNEVKFYSADRALKRILEAYYAVKKEV